MAELGMAEPIAATAFADMVQEPKSGQLTKVFAALVAAK